MRKKKEWKQRMRKIPEISGVDWLFLFIRAIFVLLCCRIEQNVFECNAVKIVCFVWCDIIFSKLWISTANVIKIKQVVSKIVFIHITGKNVKGAKSVVKAVCRFESNGQAAKKVEEKIVKSGSEVCIVFTCLCCFCPGLLLVLILSRRLKTQQM